MFVLLRDRVHVNFVDTEGQRIRVPGRIGQSLYEVAQLHNLDMDGHDSENNPYSFRRTDMWTEDEFGEGPSNAQDHIILDDTWQRKVTPPMPEEISALKDYVYHNDLTENSRLASQILLSKVSFLFASPPLRAVLFVWRLMRVATVKTFVLVFSTLFGQDIDEIVVHMVSVPPSNIP